MKNDYGKDDGFDGKNDDDEDDTWWSYDHDDEVDTMWSHDNDCDYGKDNGVDGDDENDTWWSHGNVCMLALFVPHTKHWKYLNFSWAFLKNIIFLTWLVGRCA